MCSKNVKNKILVKLLLVAIFLSAITSCSQKEISTMTSMTTEIANSDIYSTSNENIDELDEYNKIDIDELESDNDLNDIKTSDEFSDDKTNSENNDIYNIKKVYVNFKAPYAAFSIINDGYALLYEINKSKVSNYKNKTIAVNAGHGTKGGETIKTFSHPDFSPKVSGGTNAAGSILSSAVSAGMSFENGMTEQEGNLMVAEALRDKLLYDGYSVLMIRYDDDCRLDNIARTVLANENADAHIAIHFDSTASDKGIFYITPYNDPKYLNMEPLKSNIKNIKGLGDSVITAFRDMGEKIWKDKGILQGDLTQLSFSTNASIDIELGDKKTNLTEERVDTFAEGILRGINNYFE